MKYIIASLLITVGAIYADSAYDDPFHSPMHDYNPAYGITPEYRFPHERFSYPTY